MMVTRRFWVDEWPKSQNTHNAPEDEVLMPLVWRCRAIWFQVRCGKPGIVEHVDGLPDCALIPMAAAGDDQGNLREMECEMITLDSSSNDMTGSIARLHIAACVTKYGRSWFVSVEPKQGLTRDLEDACRRFGTFFTAALRMDQSLN